MNDDLVKVVCLLVRDHRMKRKDVAQLLNISEFRVRTAVRRPSVEARLRWEKRQPNLAVARSRGREATKSLTLTPSEASHLRRNMAVLDVIADGEASCRTA